MGDYHVCDIIPRKDSENREKENDEHHSVKIVSKEQKLSSVPKDTLFEFEGRYWVKGPFDRESRTYEITNGEVSRKIPGKTIVTVSWYDVTCHDEGDKDDDDMDYDEYYEL